MAKVPNSEHEHEFTFAKKLLISRGNMYFYLLVFSLFNAAIRSNLVNSNIVYVYWSLFVCW